MKKKRRSYQFEYEDNKRSIFYVGVGVVALIIVIIVIFFIAGRNKKNNAQDTLSDSIETLDYAATEDTISEIADTYTEENEDISIAAEVGSMDDEDDPQNARETVVTEEAGSVVTINTQTAGDYETSGVTLGIDVAKYQGTIDWTQVASSGIEFAMIRVGYRTQSTGVICEDPCAKYNLQQASANGIKIGIYFFSTALNETEVKEEAAWVSNFIAQYPITYPVVYNCEGFDQAGSRQYGLDKTTRTDLAITFLNYIQTEGYTGMFYASKNEMTNNTSWETDRLESQFKIWVSQYSATPYPQTIASSYTGSHAMWQYTNSGQVAGISGSVDVNVAYFQYTQINEAKDATPVEVVEANPEVGIIFQEVNETVTAKIETNLRSVPSTTKTETIVAKLKNGETANRTGIGHNGWSRVIYNGQTLYAVSNYLTTDLSYTAAASTPSSTQTADTVATDTTAATDTTGETAAQTPATATDGTYTTVSEAVTAKSEVNLRSEASTESGQVVYTLKYGETILRTGVGSNGWSRLELNGVVVYAKSVYLSTDLNYQASTEPTVDNPEAGTKFTAMNQIMTPKIKSNLRSVPSTASNDTIVAAVEFGTSLTVTGLGENGWARVEYNGQVLYTVYSYLIAYQ